MDELYCELVDIVDEQQRFQFNDIIYVQLEGVKIGGALSPWLAEVFMSNMEMRMMRQIWAPRIYHRYVDDVFSVIKKGTTDTILQKLNEQHKNIKFTCENEIDKQLPFLDLMIKREGKSFSFGIYRKPTDSPLTIPNDSHTPMIYKMAAYESMFHRLYSTPITNDSFMHERKYILDTAHLNGYNLDTILGIEKKHKKKKTANNSSNLSTHQKVHWAAT